MTTLESVAKTLGVTQADVTDHLNMIMRELDRDNMVETFLNSDPELQTQLIEAYGRAAINRLELVTTNYFIKPGVREAAQRAVLETIRSSEAAA